MLLYSHKRIVAFAQTKCWFDIAVLGVGGEQCWVKLLLRVVHYNRESIFFKESNSKINKHVYFKESNVKVCLMLFFLKIKIGLKSQFTQKNDFYK